MMPSTPRYSSLDLQYPPPASAAGSLPSPLVASNLPGESLPAPLRETNLLLAALRVDLSAVPPVEMRGGESNARGRMHAFIAEGLCGYKLARHDAGTGEVHHSGLSAYLHFGQLGALQLALAVRASAAPEADKEAFLDGLLVRRELARNMCWFEPELHDSIRGIPKWAQDSLAAHTSDPRSTLDFGKLERAQSPDPLWNAAQREMLATGVMHNRLRMYWCKQLLLWHETPEQAFNTAVHLNDKWMLDGRDPNGYMGIAWCFGRHDEPFGERPIFGAVRPMTPAGLRAKINATAYTSRVDKHVRTATSPPLRALLAGTAARGSIAAFFAPGGRAAPPSSARAAATTIHTTVATRAIPGASTLSEQGPPPVSQLTAEQTERVKRNREAALSRLHAKSARSAAE